MADETYYQIVQHHRGDEPEDRPIGMAYPVKKDAERQAKLETDAYWQTATVRAGTIRGGEFIPS